MRRIPFVPILSILLALPLSACAAGSTSGSSDGGAGDLLTAEDLADVRTRTALAAIEQLRPRWLRTRGNVGIDRSERPDLSSPTGVSEVAEEERPAVRIDSAWGTLDDLRLVQVVNVREIRFLTPREATNRYGTGYPHGIIHVVTRR